MVALSLRLLGTYSVSLDGRRVDGFATDKERALLAYLALEDDRPHRRDQLVTLLWPHLPAEKARNNFRVTLHRLRQAVDHPETDTIEATRETVMINREVAVRVDANVLAQKLEAVRRHGDENGLCSECRGGLSAATELYGGPLLAGFTAEGSQPFNEWARLKREWLQRRVLNALEKLAQHHWRRGEIEAAQRHAHRQLELEPWRERAHRQMMRALACAGEYSAAVAQFDTCRQMLADELDLEPSEKTERLYEEILVARETDFRPLPNAPGPLIGREEELEQIALQLADPACRLLTLVGPGGVGKSRLGLEVARKQTTAFLHGVCYVPLAAVDSAERFIGAIARAANYQFQNRGDRRSELFGYLQKKEMLLVLDNVEHLLDKHFLDARQLLPALLAHAPGLKVLITSRVRLNLREENVFRLQGLAVPEEDGQQQIEKVGAVRLFTERARKAQPTFHLAPQERSSILQICRLLSGMPLAIELSAAWSRLLTPQDTLARIRHSLDFLESPSPDVPDRHRSMRASFEHSWGLLDDGERDALMKLSIFRGGFTVEAAQAVAGAPLQTLAALVDHSLLWHDVPAGRLDMHELLRRFAGDKLRAAGQSDATRDAHSTYYLKVLARLLPNLKGSDQPEALEAIDADLENVRTAWRRAVTRGHWHYFPEASQSLCLFSLFRSHHHEGIELFQMAGSAGRQHPSVYAYLLAGWKMLELMVGRQAEARAAVPALRSAVEEVADPAAAAYCRLILSHILASGTAPGEASALSAEARSFYEQAQDPFYSAMALWREGMAHFNLGQRREAVASWQRGLELARAAGDRYVTGHLLHNLGSVTANWEGQSELVERYFREAIKVRRKIGARAFYAQSLGALAINLSRRDGGFARALPLIEKALAVAAAHDITYVRGQLLGDLAWYRLRQGKHEESMNLTAEALSFTRRGTYAWAKACAVRGIALLARDETAHAARLFKDCLAAMAANPGHSHLGSFLPYAAVLLAERGEPHLATELLAYGVAQPNFMAAPELELDFSPLRAELQEKLGESSFAAAWERGKDLDPVAAADEVLAALQ